MSSRLCGRLPSPRSRRSPATWARLALLAIPILIVALVPMVQAAPVRTLAINTASAEPTVAFRGFDGNPALAFDFDNDGRKEIVAQNDNQYAYVFSSENGELLAQKKTKFPDYWGARTFNGPEAYRENGVSHLVLVNSAAYVTSYRFDPATSTPDNFVFVKEWEKRMNQCNANAGSDSKATIGDLDRDGKVEIVVTTEEQGIMALRSNGALIWKNCLNGGNAEGVIADLDGDLYPEVLFGSDTGEVHALRGRTGAHYWKFNIHSKFNLGSGSIPVAVGVGQLDGLGGPDVVFGARDSHDANDWTKDHAVLAALDHSGKYLWGRQDVNGGNPLTYSRPIITDAAGDGTPEVYWADWNTIGHKPPFNEADSWKVTGPGHFYRYDAVGNMVWKQTLGTFWSNKDIPIADIDGDGNQEMLANGPNANGQDGVWFLNTATGAKEGHLALAPWKVQRMPIVTDLEGDGMMDLVIEAGQQYSGAGGASVLVYNMGVPLNTKWGHPPGPYLGAPVPPPQGDFAATFTIKSPNTWWQEVYVSPDSARTISKVQVRVEEGPWLSMTKSSWGAWTSSYNTPAGSTVEFRAFDPNNFAAQSQPFTWMDGDLSKGSVTSGGTTPPPPPPTTPPPPPPTTPPPPPPPEPTTFSATFQPSSSVNEWWIDVKVTANEPVTKVEARVNGGTWTSLPPTDWGTWAKSMHAPRGSTVQFRATSADGDIATSGDFTWLGPASSTVTFTAVSQTNNWWVEAKVSGATIVKVEASTNGGAWVSLPATDWGTWAKSYFVADGANVQFRATTSAGATHLSQSYVWG